MSDITTPKTVEELLDYWPGNIPYKGELVDYKGCMCAQGQALYFLAGVSKEDLREYEQENADTEVAKLFGISVAHSVLLRKINDLRPGAPSVVIRNPGKVITVQLDTILAFWWHIDKMSPDMWRAVQRAFDSYEDNTIHEAVKTCRRAAFVAVGVNEADYVEQSADNAAATAAASTLDDTLSVMAAGAACSEIQGAAVLRERGAPFVFLPMFGFATPEDVLKSRDTPPS